MAISTNNILNVKFLRNKTIYSTYAKALNALETNKAIAEDGTALLARYQGTGGVKTLVGYVYVNGETHDITIFDVEGSSADVEELRQEINNKLGTGVTSNNTATKQLAALSGNSATDTSATTSVEGAKKYAYDLLGTLDYTDTAATGSYVSEVNEVDGVISVSRVELPSSADTAVAKKFVTAVAEDKGQITVSRGEITSSGKTIVLSDNADGDINFEANVDGKTIIIDENTGVMSVASSALVQYEGDGKTVQISAVQNGVRTVSSPLTISSTTVTDTNVKEQFNLVNASGETVGATIKIYKDSSLQRVYLGHVDDTLSDNTDPASIVEGSGSEALCFIYHKEDGTYELVAVDVEAFLMESEFASGVTADGTTHIVHGVVDGASEGFLTVGADGFKLSGVQDAIDNAVGTAVSGLDATVTAETANQHISISIEETDGKLVQSGLTITESDIASATDLATLSGKTVTGFTSTNGSIEADIDDAVGCKTYDLQTDASKIKMSGFNTSDVLSGITQFSSITEAFLEVDNVITTNEQVTSQALNDINSRINTVSGDVNTISGNVATISGKVDTIESQYVSGVSVNGSGVTVTNHVVPLVINSTSAATSSNDGKAIVVTTNNDGSVTLNLASLDCGYYD